METTQTPSFGCPAPVLAICGWSGSGKTTLIESALPALLAQGLTVAVVKHDAHRVVIDQPGKDSERFFRAGADVLLRGGDEVFIRRHGPFAASLPEALRILAADHDLIFVEGHKKTPLPKLWLAAPEETAVPDGVSGVLAVFPWDGPRLDLFHEFLTTWLPSAWLRRPLFGAVRCRKEKTQGGSCADALTLLQLYVQWVVCVGEGPCGLARGGFGPLPATPLAGPWGDLLAPLRWAPEAAWLLVDGNASSMDKNAIDRLLGERKPGRWVVMHPSVRAHHRPIPALFEPQARAIIEALAAQGGGITDLVDHPKTYTIVE